MAEDFGSYLKSERELRGVTLDELYSKTKIPLRSLRALENNQFDQLPEEVFIRGYIRSIAKIIGAQEDEVLSTYIDISKTASQICINDQSDSNQKKSTPDLQFIFLLSLIVLFLSSAVWGVNILIHKYNKNSTKPILTLSQNKKNKEKTPNNFFAEKVKIDDTSTALTTAKLSSKTSSANSRTLIGEFPNNLSSKPDADFKNLSSTLDNGDRRETLIPIVSPDISGNKNTVDTFDSLNEGNLPLKLFIKIKGDVWFNIIVDDSPVESFVLSKGFDKIFYGNKKYLLNVGNKNLIEMTLNGKSINLPKGNKDGILANFTINRQLVE
jgi:cytoskeleton protein RodZ